MPFGIVRKCHCWLAGASVPRGNTMKTMSLLVGMLPVRPTLLAALCLLCVIPGRALDPNKTLTQYAHRTWGQEEGLIQPTIYSIAQTPDGFLWLGTQDSLIRFDGVHFREYDNAQAAGLKRNLIRALLAGPDGSLWVATIGSGVVRIRPDGGFSRLTTRRGLPSNNAFCLAPGTQGDVWICTDQGLARVGEDGRIRVFTTADGLARQWNS